MNDSGCTKTVSVRGLRTESLPFSVIPAQSKLFIQYQEDPLSLKRFYPSAVERHTDVAARADEVLANYRTDRHALCDALLRINTKFGAGPETLANIDVLRHPGSVAVLTGQQTGLFTGPLYSIYKALSAVKMAESLRQQGVKAVPVFWMATEDHDLAEVSNSFIVGRAGGLYESKVDPAGADEGLPVGSILLNESVGAAIDRMFAELPETEFSAELKGQISAAWKPGASFGEAFGTFLTVLLGKFGLIAADPLDPALKELAAPIYADAVRRSDEIVAAIIRRNSELADAGYHSQVLVEDDYFPLFWHDDDGRRMALRRKGDGTIHVKGGKTSFSVDQLAAAAAETPGRFSPGVMLRPVVQDQLFPTICYFGGGAEIAYFAQNSEVYRILERPVTTILHRQSFTFVEAKHARTLEKYGLTLPDIFDGKEAILSQLVDKFIDQDTGKLFAGAEETINAELHRLDEALSEMDITLAADLATRRRKILYHISAMQKKYWRRRFELDETVNRRINGLFAAVVPHGHLQERTLNVVSFADRFGSNFIDWAYESIDLCDKGHRVIYL
ncbi:MAG: bacillithiol biosynthesis cysteine-adding enzyme BshC [Acidobacteria bacterium]|nr:bacillithiol biosynthesis cysteine-adding enzyme BshC [Acidobacteriota bacterium]